MWKTAEYTAAGRGHLKAGMPCQDKVCTYRKDDVTVISLADGAGCAHLSHFGAEAAVQAVSRELGDHFEDYFWEGDSAVSRMRLFSKVMEALRETQARLHCHLRDLSSTLLLAAVSGSRYFIVHIGDGVIGYLKNDRIEVATCPDNGTFANETFFTTASTAPSRMRILRGTDKEIHGFVLMSDGTENALYSKRCGKLSQGIKRIMKMAVLCPDGAMQRLFSEAFESSILPLTQDDCSISVLVDSTAFPDFRTMSVPEKLDLLQLGPDARDKARRIRLTGEILRIASCGASARQIAGQAHVKPKHIHRKLDFLVSLGLLDKVGGIYYAAQDEVYTNPQKIISREKEVKRMKSSDVICHPIEDAPQGKGDITMRNAGETVTTISTIGKENVSMNNTSKTCTTINSVKKENMTMKNTITTDTATAKKEDIRMEKIMKTGIIAAGTAAAGLALGMSPMTVHAAETEPNDVLVQANAETAVPESAAEAGEVLNTAQSDVEKTAAAFKEAQARADEAQATVDKAADAKEAAGAAADKAFEEAKSEAARAADTAQKELEAAEKDVADAAGKVQQADDATAAAQEAFKEAESSAEEAASECPVTENDITEKETALDKAEAAAGDAETKLNEAERARDEAASALADKEAVKSEAEEAVRQAETEKNAADLAADAAKEAADLAADDLQTAEKLKDGTLDIKDTTQYREDKEAKEKMDKAAENAEQAAGEVDEAADNLTCSEDAVKAAEKELDSAVKDFNSREAEASEAEKAKETAGNAKEEAQKAYDASVTEAAEADAAVSAAERAAGEAREAVKAAESAKTDADNAVKTAAAAIDTAGKDAEAAIDAAIAAAEKDVVEKTAATAEAQEALDSAAEKYKQGTLGFIDWMLAKEGLSKDQIQDLTFAREVLVNASEEDFTMWDGYVSSRFPEERNDKVVVIGDEKDATNLENLLKSLEVMEKINELRASDDNYVDDMKRNPSYTNFYFMATAEAGAMRGAGLGRHSSLTTSCENLAFRFADPTAGWYTQEKAIFDTLKSRLGITKITGSADIKRIEAEASKYNTTVGHYTNLFWSADQLMGVAYTDYGKTFCYNASKASNYTDDRINRAMHLYTVDDFRQLVSDYYQTVNQSACQEALEKAAARQTEAEAYLQSLKDNKAAAVEAALESARAALASKETAAAEAAGKLSAAKDALASAEKALEEAGAEQTAAVQAQQEALKLLDKATEESRLADTDYAFAVKARDEAAQSVSLAEEALKDAMRGKASAETLLAEKRDALSDADFVLDEAVAEYAAAEKRLEALTSDGTIDSLKEKKLQAEADLQNALSNQASRNEALTESQTALTEAEQASADAEAALQDAEYQLADALAARDSASEEVSRISEELTLLREQYAPVLRAVAARSAAEKAFAQAHSALMAARAELMTAKGNLVQAQLSKSLSDNRLLRATGLSVQEALETDIEDSDFAYLNDYVSAVKAADTRLQEAQKGLKNAREDLSVRKLDHEKAQKAYISALADQALLQEQETGVTSVSSPKLTAASADCVISSAPVATGDTSNAAVLLGELLAGAGVMALVLKMRKEADEKDSL